MTRRTVILFILVISALFITYNRAEAFTFNLDSIAAMGRFPKFCINTYRWGDKFFNGYDTTYVMPTENRFNIKLKQNTLINNYAFDFKDGQRLDLSTQATTTAGLWLTYMAVSVGYDINIKELFGGGPRDNRHRFSFQFNCMLFGAQAYWENSDLTARFREGNLDIPEEMRNNIDWRISTDAWGLDLYYFFNHKHYSQAAAYTYGRIQVKSSGSFFAGLSFWGQDNTFHFSELPEEIKQQIPTQYRNNYHAKNRNYTVKFGYGYNFVIRRNITIGLSDAPYIGLSSGYINTGNYKYGLALYNQARLSFIYNRKHWFAGVIGNINTAVTHDKQHSLFNTAVNIEASFGYRFNLW